MRKPQIIVIIISAISVALLFILPRSVLNKSENTTLSSDLASSTASHSDLLGLLNDSIVAIYRDSISKIEIIEKKATFADSLERMYFRAGFYDSSAHYMEYRAGLLGDKELEEKSGFRYYKAYRNSISESQLENNAKKVKTILGTIYAQDSSRMDIQAVMAVLDIQKQAPMKVVGDLKNIVAKDSSNSEAYFSLGLLSLQSTQYDKGVERFRKVVDIQPDNYEAWHLLGTCYLQMEQKDMAKDALSMAVKLNSYDLLLKSESNKMLLNISVSQSKN